MFLVCHPHSNKRKIAIAINQGLATCLFFSGVIRGMLAPHYAFPENSPPMTRGIF